MDRGLLAVLVLLMIVFLLLPLGVKASEAPNIIEAEPETSAFVDAYITEGAADDPAAPPPQHEAIPLGFSGDIGTIEITPPQTELEALTEILDILRVLYALVIVGISCLIVRFIIDVSLRIFTKYTGL